MSGNVGGRSRGGRAGGALALVLVCAAQLMVVLDSTITNIALPRIGSSLEISGAGLSWLVTGYALAFGGFLVVGGRLGDVYGSRRMFIAGLLIFSAGSALGGAAQTESLLLAARLAQGLGAALVSPAALALITLSFAPGPRRTRAFSAFSATAGVGGGVGLILGGWLTGLDPEWGWRLTFLINVPIGLAAAVLARGVFAVSPRHTRTLDAPGAALGTIALITLVYGVTRTGGIADDGGVIGWGDPVVLAMLMIAGLLLVAFVVVERRSAAPMLPLAIVAHRQRATAYLAMTIMPGALFAMLYFLSLYLQNVLGYSPLQTGFAFLPFTLGIIVGSLAAGRVIVRIAPRFVAGAGAVLAGIALYMFSRLPTVEPGDPILATARHGDPLVVGVNYWTDIGPFVLLMSVGIGLTFTTLTLVAMHRLPGRDVGVASGVLNAVQQVGGALGLAVLSAAAAPVMSKTAGDIAAQLGEGLSDVAIRAGFSHGASLALFIGAVMLAITAVVVVGFLSITPRDLAEAGGSD